MLESTKNNINLRIGFWRGKMEQNPNLSDICLKEIAKLEQEREQFNNKKKFYERD